jgi:hypothetical protein
VIPNTEDLMKKLILVALALMAVPMFAGTIDFNGPHYNLNIVGKTNCAGDDLTGSNRHVIQVLLNGGDNATKLNGSNYSLISRVNKIFLSGTTDGSFQVLDGNACDGNGAQFQLPVTCTVAIDGTQVCSFTSYQIWARALGKPGGSAVMTTCAVDTMGTTDTTDDLVVCSTLNTADALVRKNGTPVWKNVTTELTTITATVNGTLVTIPIFDAGLYDYFWNYDNSGLRLAQLRFYPIQ